MIVKELKILGCKYLQTTIPCECLKLVTCARKIYIVHVRYILNSVDACRLVSEHGVTDQCHVTGNTSATMFSRFGKSKKGK